MCCQVGLVTLYKSMLTEYGISSAQVHNKYVQPLANTLHVCPELIHAAAEMTVLLTYFTQGINPFLPSYLRMVLLMGNNINWSTP